jgi:hypothetical protein
MTGHHTETGEDPPMKRFLGICAAGLGAMILGAGAAPACEIYHAIEFQTDFGFHLAGQTFPPGTYAVERTDLQYGQPLRLVKAGMSSGVDFYTSDVESPTPADGDHVVFEIVDGKHVLAEVWLGGRKTGCAVVQETARGSGEKKKVEGKKKQHSSESE